MTTGPSSTSPGSSAEPVEIETTRHEYREELGSLESRALDVIDNMNRECFQAALEVGDEIDRPKWTMTMLLVARALERIGDNAVDVGEQVAFVVTGLFREFEDASHPGEPLEPQPNP